MSEIETRYFATPKSLKDFNPSFVFHWADKNNVSINDWKKIIQNFLMIPMAHQMVGDYLVIDESVNPENRRHMLMRPYQVYALQAVELATLKIELSMVALFGIQLVLGRQLPALRQPYFYQLE